MGALSRLARLLDGAVVNAPADPGSLRDADLELARGVRPQIAIVPDSFQNWNL